ncbi:MAG: hypothetical protein WBC83_03675 [Minisyncoccia bacterium]
MNEIKNAVQKKTTKERSAAYPAIPLEQAVTFSIKLQAAFGKSPFSRESAVKEMGYKTVTGTSGMSVSSLVHFGLLGRDGNAYRNSELSLRIAHPINDDDFKSAIEIAAFKPKLYRALLVEFTGLSVPTALGSILIRNHKISSKVSDDVASVFRKTIEYAGLYPNGIVSSDLPETEEGTKEVQAGASSSTTAPISQMRRTASPASNHSENLNVAPNMTSVELPSGITLSYPKNLAYAFTIGTFGKEISALEESIQKEIKKNASNNSTENNTSSAE